MGSIPLPALGVKPVEQPDTLGNIAKLIQLKTAMTQAQNAPLQQQLLQQEVQRGQTQNQMTQQDMADRAAYTKAWASWDGKNPDDLTKSIVANGGSGKAASQAAQDLLKIKDTSSQIAERLSTADKNTQEAYKQKQGFLAGSLNEAANAPDANLPQAIISAATQLKQNGIAGDNELQQAQQLAQLAQSDPATARLQLQSMIRSHQTLADQTEQRLKDIQEKKSGADLAKTTAETSKINQEMGTGKAAYEQTLADLQQGKQVTPDRLAAARAYEASESKSTSSSDAYGVKSTNVSQPTGLSEMRAASQARFNAVRAPMQNNAAAPAANAAPDAASAVPSAAAANPSSIVDQIGMGKMAPNRIEQLLTRSPNLMEAVSRKYPDFDSSKVRGYADAYRSFTSGPDAKTMNAGAVGIQHLVQLKQLNDDNPIEVHIAGTDPYNRFHNLLDTVADELLTLYGEPKTNESIASKKSTLGALFNRDGAIQEQAKAMGVKLDEMEQKWQNAAPSKSYQAPMPGMSDKAKQARAILDPEYAQRIGGGGGSPAPATAPAAPAAGGFNWNAHPVVK